MQPDPSLAAHEKGLTITPDRRGTSERVGEPYRATGGPKEPCEGLQWVCGQCRSGPAGRDDPKRLTKKYDAARKSDGGRTKPATDALGRSGLL